MIFLLSTQTLLDVLAGTPSTQKWQAGVAMQDVLISVVSVGQAIDMIQRDPNPTARANLVRQLDSLVSVIRLNQGLVPFDEESAKVWALLQAMILEYKWPDGTTHELSPVSRMVVATALQKGVTLVEDPQPYHSAIASLKIVSPW